jgi:hypothetical protein
MSNTIHWAGGLPGNYSLTLSSNWTGSILPGAGDIAVLDAASTGPYTLLGDVTYGEIEVLGNTAALKGTITASQSFSTDLVVSSGGSFTIAATGAFLGADNVQVGNTTSFGLLDVLGSFTAGVIDLLAWPDARTHRGWGARGRVAAARFIRLARPFDAARRYAGAGASFGQWRHHHSRVGARRGALI